MEVRELGRYARHGLIAPKTIDRRVITSKLESHVKVRELGRYARHGLMEAKTVDRRFTELG